ncbi:MAG: phosphogluconate dehydrogenase (NAD(+)-dependent, decarboxylating) [Thermoleophilia bacterium]
MRLGFVGLGKMGGNMVQRLLEDGHEIVAHDPDAQALKQAAARGAIAVENLESLAATLQAPRLVWLMVPSGHVTGQVIAGLQPHLESGDVIVDGGNSYYRDSMERASRLSQHGVHFLDAGTSGGIWGLKEGYCMMIGGDKEAFETAAPAFRSLAPEDGFAHVGPSGAGHYVKMVHNAIEYVMLEGYAEGFELLHSKTEFDLDLKQVSELWTHGSVIRSWLLDLAILAFGQDPGLESIEGYVDDTGEGRWTAIESIESAIPAPALVLSLQQRFRSRQQSSFAARFIAAERQQFGGHAVRKKGS